MKRTLLSASLSLILAASATSREFRTLTNQQGKALEAEILEIVDGEQVKFRAKGQVYLLPLTSLSEDDQAWLKEWEAAQSGDEGGATEYGELIFEDDFEDGFGELWGHWQSDSVVEEGIMIGKTTDIKVHAGVDNLKFEGRRDLEISVKFNFAGEEAQRFNVWMDDGDYKDSHAGHISNVVITPTTLTLSDAKTGQFENEIYAKRKSGAPLDEATQELLKTKSKSFDLELERETWYTLLIQTKGETVTVSIDGDEVGEFASIGNAHETKSRVSLTTNVNDVHYDDFSLRAAKPE